jgi:ceramide glucosyltransferase
MMMSIQGGTGAGIDLASISHLGFDWLGLLLAAAAALYAGIAWLAVSLHRRPPEPVLHCSPPVTILKPLCGTEPETYQCLRSFCDQDYPNFQIVFGVSHDADPAVALVRRLQKEFPGRSLDLVVDRQRHGSSLKVSNLINMMTCARHDFLVLADSDVRVGRDYLTRVIAPLLSGGVGIVTCSYQGESRAGLWSALGCAFINEWFMPSVRVAALSGSRAFAFGATIALRRQVLSNIGGFAAIANQLADDYRLGELTRRLGLRTVLSEVVVEVCVSERSLAALMQHELRWLRTIRALQPLGYGFSFVTCGVPVAAVGTLLAGGSAPAMALLGMTIIARLLLHLKTRRRGSAALQVLLLPARDLLTLGLWSWSFATRRVRWRNDDYRVARDGSVLPV